MSRSDEKLKEHCLGAPLPQGSWYTRCPQCEEHIPGGTLECPKCGHDFRTDPPPETDNTLSAHLHDELAYTPIAEFALSAGQAIAILGCLAAIGGMALALFCGKWTALIWGPLGTVFCLALYVVFVRVQDAGRGE